MPETNPILQSLYARKSVRVFEEKAIPAGMKQAILEAAAQAPSAGCQQLYTILDITDPALKTALSDSCDHQPFIAKAPLVLVFMANFGHPITRTFASRYADTYTSLHDGGFALVVRSRADKLSRSIGPNTLPYPLLCDAAGVLYEHLAIPTSKSTLMSYSLEGWRILREAKKQGYQPVKGAEQQLPLTLILDRDGTVLFCHYGASLTDVPEDCAAIQSLLEELELTPDYEEAGMPSYAEPEAAMAAESRPRAHHGRRAPEDTGGFQPVRQIREYTVPDLEKTSMFGLFDDPYDEN